MLAGRSYCPKCKKSISSKDLIPIISYLLLKGKCRHCKKKISKSYPLTELATALIFVISYVNLPQSFTNTTNLTYLIITLIFFSIIIFTFVYDLKYMEVADSVLLPGIIFAALATIHPLTPTIFSALIGATIIFGFFFLQILISKGRWIGGGDLRIAVFMGLMLGWPLALSGLVISYLIGSIISIFLLIVNRNCKMKTAIPFAPFLSIGTFLTYFYGAAITGWYLSHTGLIN